MSNFLENVKEICNKWEEFEDVLSILNTKNANSERYFDVFELDEYYTRNQEFVPEGCYETNYQKANENLKQIIKYSEKLGIKPDLKHDLDELKEQYIERIENKLQSLLEEHTEAKNKENERDNMQVLAKEHDRG